MKKSESECAGAGFRVVTAAGVLADALKTADAAMSRRRGDLDRFRSVLLESIDGRSLVAVATDGYSMHVSAPAGIAGAALDGPSRCVLSAEDTRILRLFVSGAPRRADMVAALGESGLVVRHGKHQVRFAAGDYAYPDWRRVVAEAERSLGGEGGRSVTTRMDDAAWRLRRLCSSMNAAAAKGASPDDRYACVMSLQENCDHAPPALLLRPFAPFSASPGALLLDQTDPASRATPGAPPATLRISARRLLNAVRCVGSPAGRVTIRWAPPAGTAIGRPPIRGDGQVPVSVTGDAGFALIMPQRGSS